MAAKAPSGTQNIVQLSPETPKSPVKEEMGSGIQKPPKAVKKQEKGEINMSDFQDLMGSKKDTQESSKQQ